MIVLMIVLKRGKVSIQKDLSRFKEAASF